MKHIYIYNGKGGCGKTTVAINLAALLSCHGQSVFLADHDVQKSASDWLNARPENCAPIKLKAPSDAINDRDEDARKVLVVHDFPAACPSADVQLLLDAHSQAEKFIIIPMLASPADIKAGLRFMMALDRHGLMGAATKVGIIANRIKTNTYYAGVLDQFLLKMRVPIIAKIGDSQNYIRAMDRGLSIFDLPPSRVKSERQKWQPVIRWLEV